MARRSGLLLLGAVCLMLVSARAQAGLAQQEGRIAIREIDTTDFPTVRLEVLIAGEQPDRSSFVLRENDRIVDQLLVVPIQTSVDPVSVVVVFDRSGSMEDNGAIGPARSAARVFVEGARPEDRIALVAFAGTADVLAPFGSDREALLDVVDHLESVRPGTALWDAVGVSAGLLADEPSKERYMIVVSDIDAGSYDNASTATAAIATRAAVDVGATVFAVELPFGPVDDREIQALTDQTSGLLLTTTNPEDLGTLFAELQRSLQARYEITYQSEALPPAVDVLLSAEGSQARSAYTIPEVATQEPESDDSSGLPAGFGFLVVAAIAAVSLVVVAVRGRR